ncbi:MAG: PAS domain-containing protein [Desulfobacteraceae bacterium]|nr:PAS domain-containing protein [Desulfobacteraceae bacterium]
MGQKNKIENKINRVAGKDWEKTVDAIDDWICIIDLHSTILRSNRKVEKNFQVKVQDSIGLKCCKLLHGTDHPIAACPLPKMLETGKRESVECEIKKDCWMHITVDPIFNGAGKMIGAVHIIRDISQRVLIENERQRLVNELQDALGRIKTLSGLIPICSMCKKIRDDKGYWSLIESYVESHSDAAFSHGICPKCSEDLYGKEGWYINMKQKQNKKK